MSDKRKNKMSQNGVDCKHCRGKMADLLLDDQFASTRTEFAAHMAECQGCTAELTELRRTFAVMDEWTAPEPSAYFDTRMHARLREAEAAQPEGLFERIRAFFLFSTGRMMRPVMTGALGLIVLAGGGTFAGLHTWTTNANASATVNDLRILDNNAQALQQMDQLLDDNSGDDNGTPPVS